MPRAALHDTLLSSDQRYFPTDQISDIPCLNTSREMNLAMTTEDQQTLLGVSITGALSFVGIVPTAQQRHQHGLPQAKFNSPQTAAISI